MKNILFVISLILLAYSAPCQFVFSSDRPAGSTTFKPFIEDPEEVIMAIDGKFVEGHRQQAKWQCIYNKSGNYEGMVFYADVLFTVTDSVSGLKTPVKPDAWAYKPDIRRGSYDVDPLFYYTPAAPAIIPWGEFFIYRTSESHTVPCGNTISNGTN